MGLYARISAQDATKISVHRFGAALREWATNGLTRADVITAFNLSAAETTELDALAATYAALPTTTTANAISKAAFLDRMEDVFLLVETGDYPESKAKARLGF